MSAAAERLDVKRIAEHVPGAILKIKEYRGDVFVCVRKERLRDVISLLKDDPELDYRYFSECLGVDYSAWQHERDLPNRFEVVYNLMSMKSYDRLFIKVGVDDGEEIDTIKDIFLGSEYPEREINDLFGIVFKGNVHEGRFLMPDDWVGFPLRKEYPLGGEDVSFDQDTLGPAVEDISMPHAGESFEGKTGSEDVSGR
ncbi:MAG: NAD(P)H-quinone oxidoreductase subunit J, chloroplastic [Fimbriimonadaceae bacterium]|nr:NAD(P)H-quinone oxidoreductase subunit J, chloroplastic [Fimbriimonadaceae bacterium]